MKKIPYEANLGKLEQVYFTILQNMEEKANRVDSKKILSNIPPVFTSNSSQDTCAGNFALRDDTNGNLVKFEIFIL